MNMTLGGCAVWTCLLGFVASPAHAQAIIPSIGGNGVTVHAQFGGDIFGYDIDPNGSEGLLCEAAFNSAEWAFLAGEWRTRVSV